MSTAEESIIQPAKSEDKLEIEKEEKERLEKEAKENEDDMKKEEDEDEDEEDEEKSGEEKAEDDEAKDKDAEKDKQESSSGAASPEDKKFKIKTPNIAGFLRSKSRERAAKKDEVDNGDDAEKKDEKDADAGDKDGKKQKPAPKAGKKKKNRGKRKPKFMSKKKEDEDEDKDNNDKEKDEEKDKSDEQKASEAKDEAKEDENKGDKAEEAKDEKKDAGDEKKEAEEKSAADKDKEDSNKKEDAEDKKTEKKEDAEQSEEDKKQEESSESSDNKKEDPSSSSSSSETKKSSGFFDTLKSSMSSVPSLFTSKKSGSKDKDPEKGAKAEEEQELLEKEPKDDDKKADDKESKDSKDDDKSEKEAEAVDEKQGEKTEAEKGAEEDKTKTDKQTDKEDKEKPKDETDSRTRAGGFFSNLRLPNLFGGLRGGDRVADIETGECKKLLDETEDKDKKKDKSERPAEQDSNKQSEEEDLEEVKVIPDDGEKSKDADAASASGSEKKDPEKQDSEGKCDEKKCVILTQLRELDNQKRLGLCGIVAGLALLILLIVLIAVCAPSGDWTNEARIVGSGKRVETHTSCGPVQGLVDAPNQFSFYGIPYAVPAVGPEGRWTHARPAVELAECYEGKLYAHTLEDQKEKKSNATEEGNPESGYSHCFRRLPDGSLSGREDCLHLQVFTSNLVYNELLPVVVFINGDDLTDIEDTKLQPSSRLAHDNKVVYVSVNYRRSALGFLSLKSLARREYPQTAGNYGLGDIVAALKWVNLNIQHFGGHPAKVTLLGRGSGATLATALTAVPRARGLFAAIWATNGHGVYDNKTLDEANMENKIILNHLACGADELQCLLHNRNATDIMKAVPKEWDSVLQAPDLPKKDEGRDHSWLTSDKLLLFENPIQYWIDHQLTNKVPMVIGSTAQAAATSGNKDFANWTVESEYVARVRSKLDTFNATVAAAALKEYNSSDFKGNNFAAFSAMVSDIRTVCPLQQMAMTAASNFVANVYSYISVMPRSTELGALADRSSDIAALFGTWRPLNEREKKYQQHMRNMFYQFVREQKLPAGNKDLTIGTYLVSDELKTQKDYPRCRFWAEQEGFVPDHAFTY